MDAACNAAAWVATVALAEADAPRRRSAMERARVMDSFRIHWVNSRPALDFGCVARVASNGGDVSGRLCGEAAEEDNEPWCDEAACLHCHGYVVEALLLREFDVRLVLYRPKKILGGERASRGPKV
jgi:hypothetical protein